MDTYKTTSALEALLNIKKGDNIQITSFSPVPSYKEGNEKYILSILVTRNAEKIEDKPAEKTVRNHPAGTIIP